MCGSLRRASVRKIEHEIGHPHDHQPDVGVPFRLGVFLRLGDAHHVAGDGEDAEQVVAEQHEPRAELVRQPRARCPLQHIERGYLLSPRTKVDNPVPPPKMTIFFMLPDRRIVSALSFFNIPMGDNCPVFFLESFSKIFSECYRTVLSACTPKRDNDLRFPFILILWNEEFIQIG